MKTEKSDKLTEKKPVVAQASNTKRIKHTGFGEKSIVQDYVNYAYSLGGIEFVAMMECENGTWDTHRWGDGGKSLGLCQIHKQRHKEVNDPNFKKDRKYQIDVCYEKRIGGTKFYGPTRPLKEGLCRNVVKKRFIY